MSLQTQKSALSLKSLVLGFCVLGSTVIAPSPGLAIDENDRPAIEKIIREYLIANPEVLVEMQQALEAKREAEQSERQKQILSERQKDLYESPYTVTVGNPDAPITVVEFFDYNCGFCQRAMEDMQRVLENRDDVKFVLKEFPVLGEASFDAHRVSLAFTQLMPEKAAEYHMRLLGSVGRKDGLLAMQVATELGATKDQIEAEMEKPFIEEAIQTAYQIADGLSISGTPSYVIGDQVIFGAVGYDQITSAIDKLKTE